MYISQVSGERLQDHWSSGILDFEKAFDTPPHELLKSKLFSYGIGGKTLEWINAFFVLQAAKGSS